jgi:uncharacterized protein involved in outer membrane biogenesis
MRLRWTRIILIGGGVIVALFLVLTLAVSFLVKSDAVRQAIETQATAALGKPVKIGSLRAAVFPRIALRLDQVTVGQPPEIAIGSASIATGLGGLLKGRVEEAELRLAKARVKLPLALGVTADRPAPTPAPPAVPRPTSTPTPAPTPAPASSGPAFTIASVRSVKVEDFQVEAGGKTVRVDLEGSLDGERLEVNRLDLTADKTEITGKASLRSFQALDGTFSIDAKMLDLDGLLALVAMLAPPGAKPADPKAAPDVKQPEPRATSATPAPGAGAPLARKLEGKIRAVAGTYQGIPFRDLAGDLRIQGNDVALAPVQLKLLGGRYDGTVALGLVENTARVTYEGRLQAIDLAEVSKIFNSPGTASGTLHFDLSLAGAGSTLEVALKRSAGKGAVRITDLKVKGLDLLHTALTFLGDSGEAARAKSASSQLTGTLAIGDQRIATQDLRLESPDFELNGKGAVGFRGALDFAVDLLVSEALSSRVKGSAARYAKEGNRIVMPMRVGGDLRKPSVSVDAGALARRLSGVAAGEAGKKLEDKLREELSKFLRRSK